MQDGDETAAEGSAAPITTRFQLLLGPEGACRIVLFANTDAEDRPLATLDMIAEDADLLASLLTARREAYEKARREQKGGQQQ